MTVKPLCKIALFGLFTLAACGNPGSAVETRDRSGSDAEVSMTSAAASDDLQIDRAETPKPALTANRRETVDAKTERLFARNGAAFGAKTAQDYLDKVQAFTANPPRDADRVQRPNGDVLLYQASTNTFAVVSRDGVPKTMFKPDDGANYWAQQKERAPTFGQRRGAAGSSE